MAEFLKNNPIALRHCLLYQCLQGKSVGKAFYEFCQIVGDDVIKKKQFQSWFDKFFWGFFDDANEPITNMRDIFRNDKHALRTCILFESLKYKRRDKNIDERLLKTYQKLVYRRSISAHKDFCKAIGEDVMEYREFDFWFHRFLNGNYDLNYEVDKDKKFSELIDMPLDVMENILEYLDIFDRISLARTSRSFKTFVEDQKLFHPKLILHVNEHAAFITYGILYRTKSYENYTILKEGVPYWKEAIQKIKAVLNYPKLHILNLKFQFYAHPTLIAEMTDELLSNYQLHVKNLSFEAHSMDPLLKILPLFTPGYLTEINVSVQKMDDTVMNKVTELKQWKQATRVSVNADLFIPW